MLHGGWGTSSCRSPLASPKGRARARCAYCSVFGIQSNSTNNLSIILHKRN
ncbi:MAG: hypothetical protein J6I89_00480 [Oscillospiraceae bacterium]|nr:hypothetical protein [Oscillospiraceae bacterium]